jgi:hypothetical protein
MKKEKLYKLIKGSGGGANSNAIGIEITGRSMDSAVFVGKVRLRAEQLFGKGASGNSIATTYGVHFKYEDEQKNRKMAKMLIKIVELEQELLKMRNS